MSFFQPSLFARCFLPLLSLSLACSVHAANTEITYPVAFQGIMANPANPPLQVVLDWCIRYQLNYYPSGSPVEVKGASFYDQFTARPYVMTFEPQDRLSPTSIRGQASSFWHRYTDYKYVGVWGLESTTSTWSINPGAGFPSLKAYYFSQCVPEGWLGFTYNRVQSGDQKFELQVRERTGLPFAAKLTFHGRQIVAGMITSTSISKVVNVELTGYGSQWIYFSPFENIAISNIVASPLLPPRG